MAKGIESTREATRYLAARLRAKDNAAAAQNSGLLIARDGDLIDRCHAGDFRDVAVRLADGCVSLVIADPPYGHYVSVPDGVHTTTCTTRSDCDGLHDADARQATVDLLCLMAPKMTVGGCLVLFRPGGCMDPVWLTTAIDEQGWACHRALTWNKKRVKLGKGDEPYGISTERLLVLYRKGDALVAHDSSDRADVLDFTPIRPNAATGGAHHLFEKPVEMMKFLVSKHTYEGQLVMEPFGGTGPASLAAIHLNRHWLYCETNSENLTMATARLGKETSPPTAIAS